MASRTGHAAAPMQIVRHAELMAEMYVLPLLVVQRRHSSGRAQSLLHTTHKGMTECKFPSRVKGDLLGTVADSVQPHFALEAAGGYQLGTGGKPYRPHVL